ncbi:ribosomal L7Ae/L30e/S12e/Gadd45 family protein [Veillonella agrestimuris]|uniref:ribosomal L7Ae/L30e/S12e/Gadd45 family protein n=1 Tax=Veillonella agrestimuris TaxID=2941340 RepID=UPI00203FC4BB|nr:ribosomal L7Ae/L30e/S12e/Gadd45 family protein [Veillonella agrestimuris]
MDINQLASIDKTIGAKQTLKAIAKGSVKFVFLGYDGDSYVVDPIRTACIEAGIPVDDKHTMDELGRACRIKVGATAVGVFR